MFHSRAKSGIIILTGVIYTYASVFNCLEIDHIIWLLQGAIGGSMLGFSFSLWLSIGAVLYRKSPLLDNLSLGMCLSNDSWSETSTTETSMTTDMWTRQPEGDRYTS